MLPYQVGRAAGQCGRAQPGESVYGLCLGLGKGGLGQQVPEGRQDRLGVGGQRRPQGGGQLGVPGGREAPQRRFQVPGAFCRVAD
ncbi:hypothetical protein ACWV95_27800 [Streptomyces albus]